MNYSTQALENLHVVYKAFVRTGFERDAMGMLSVVQTLKAAQKFVVPPPDKLHITVKEDALTFLRCPYPIWAIEYSVPNAKEHSAVDGLETSKSTRRIALCIDIQHPTNPIAQVTRETLPEYHANMHGFLVISLFWQDHFGMWALAPGYAVVAPELLQYKEGDHGPLYVADTKYRMALTVRPLMPDTLDQLIDEYIRDGYPGEKAGNYIVDVINNDVWEEVATAIRVTIMLNTRNLRAVKVVEPSTKLNKKRENNGKPPFFTYYSLDVFVGDNVRKVRRLDPNAIQQMFSSSGLSKAWHTVIGHFKVRKTGIFFWRPHERGSKKTGEIRKEYNVHPK